MICTPPKGSLALWAASVTGRCCWCRGGQQLRTKPDRERSRRRQQVLPRRRSSPHRPNQSQTAFHQESRQRSEQRRQRSVCRLERLARPCRVEGPGSSKARMHRSPIPETSSCHAANDRFGSVPFSRARTTASGKACCTAARHVVTRSCRRRERRCTSIRQLGPHRCDADERLLLPRAAVELGNVDRRQRGRSRQSALAPRESAEVALPFFGKDRPAPPAWDGAGLLSRNAWLSSTRIDWLWSRPKTHGMDHSVTPSL
jgi:hypothetical protein